MAASTMTTATFEGMTGSLPRSRALRFEVGSVVGLLTRTSQIPGLIATLTGTGIERQSIQIMTSSALERESSRVFDWLGGWLAWLGPEGRLSDQYRAELAAGAVVVAVRNVSGDERDRVAGALTSAGGYFVHGFGRFTVRRMAA